MDEALLKKLQDKDFAAKILELGSKEEVKSFLKNEGYEISNEELDHMAETLKGIANEIIKDLSDKELESTGGGTLLGIISAVGTVAFSGMQVFGAVKTVNHMMNPPPPPRMSFETKLVLGTAAGAAIGTGVAVGGALLLKKLKKSGWWSDAKPAEETKQTI